MIYCTSDLHLGHDKPFIYEKRGFSSIQEHDDAIVKNWNDTVGADDITYIIGDVMMGVNTRHALELLSQLNGKIIILRGNHDTDVKFNNYITKLPNVLVEETIKDTYARPIKIGKRSYYLSHRPTIMGPFIPNNQMPHEFCLHGHTHSTDRFEYIDYCCYNIGLDAHDLRPVSMEEIREDILAKMEEKIRETAADCQT